jgi:hypothetical protein
MWASYVPCGVDQPHCMMAKVRRKRKRDDEDAHA